MNPTPRSMTPDSVSDQKRLPSQEVCRTRYLGETLKFSSCLVENSDACEHAVRFGASVFCRHTDRRGFEKAATLMPLL